MENEESERMNGRCINLQNERNGRNVRKFGAISRGFLYKEIKGLKLKEDQKRNGR